MEVRPCESFQTSLREEEYEVFSIAAHVFRSLKPNQRPRFKEINDIAKLYEKYCHVFASIALCFANAVHLMEARFPSTHRFS